MTAEQSADLGVVLGERYRDRATGFEGVAVGIWIRWEVAEPQVSLARLDSNGATTAEWFDAGRLEALWTSPTTPGFKPRTPR